MADVGERAAFTRPMLVIGRVDGRLHDPHEWDPDCEELGCVPMPDDWPDGRSYGGREVTHDD